jgi:RNA polymerase sigma factor (sigma-70 family)
MTPPGPGAGGDRFPTTRASAVVGVRSPEASERARSLETLVAAYWKPVYKYIRVRRGCRPDEAEDLTQGFFLRAMEKRFFDTYEPAKGRFRTFLRTCLEGYLSNELRAERRLKRGGGAVPLSLDFEGAERELSELPSAGSASPEDFFQAEWVRALFDRALESLRSECASRGKEIHFRIFQRYDLEEPGGERPTYADLAAELGIPASDVTNHLARVRREFRRILLDSLREITAGEEEFQREARILLGARGDRA